ncbi:hypothetical protein [Candidatus Liberibacter asiaticus]|uniref:Uncharacterized protein n=2 Tax=Liberibacter asiaticus TaxID=34021 RepID=C6XFI7_LIBAP|nr:hypothetical protein [Candidatus Liberibacter asiaticus]ACT57140.1 hypothetical protein CLIBASIA_02770 [Candidatus Liberibacter asiaticus str. psy62]AGH16897.1 hypothetical protein WSI_02635 [Candidatus Liberibacter asiaticus str. gxpsy]
MMKGLLHADDIEFRFTAVQRLVFAFYPSAVVWEFGRILTATCQ